MNLSESVIKLCNSIRRENRIVNENVLSIKYDIQYTQDDTLDYPFILDFSSTSTDRLEFIQNTIQELQDSNSWRVLSRENDNSFQKNICSSKNGDLIIYYRLGITYPDSVSFEDKRDSDEFYSLISVDIISEEPEETEEPEDNEQAPEDIAARNENEDGTVNPGESANGDNEESLNVA